MEKERLGVGILNDKKCVRIPDSVLKRLNLNCNDLIIFHNDKENNKAQISKGELK